MAQEKLITLENLDTFKNNLKTHYYVGSTLFGRCSTEADATVKIVTLDNFDQLIDGVTIHVLFDNKNTATQPSLNVNGTGAKSIKRFNADDMMTPIKPYWKAGSIVEFTYFSNKWIINNYQSSIDGEHLIDASSEAQEDGAIRFTEITNNDDTYTLLKDVKVKGWDDLTDRVSENEMSLSSEIVETTPSNPLTFTTRSAQNAQSAEIILEPIQDLHGYDHPWPAGGGKNKLPNILVSGTTDGITYSVDSGGVVTCNGTAASTVYLNVTPTSGIPLRAGTYILSGCPSGGASNKYLIYDNGTIVDTGKGATFTLSEDTNKRVIIRITGGQTVSNLVFKPMIRLATETDATFAPYSNICPISGHTEVSVGGCGKNLYDKEHLYDGVYDRTGNLLFGSNYKHSMTPCKESQIYSLYRSNRAFGGYIAALLTSDKVFISIIIGNGQYNQTFTTPLNAAYIAVQTSESDDIINEMLVEGTDIFTHYEPYTPSNDLTKDLGQEVFGASYNPVSGDLVVTWGYIAEYNGETLPGEWISDRDVYEPNTSPSTGAEVAYELATPITYHLTPDEIKLLSGVNTIWTDGTSIKVSYRDGKVATLADLQEISDSPFKIVNGALCWISNK